LLLFICYAGHDFDALRTARDNRPIRGANRLFFIDGVRAEAVATGLERMFHHLGVVEYVPRADELTYNLKALRAARSIADLKMHSNEMTFEEAFQFCIDNTPYGWVPEGSSTLWHDLELYLRLPLYGTSYLAGPVQLEKVITDAVRIKGDDFNMTEFMDEFFEAGMTPLSLISYEMLGHHHVGSTVIDVNDVLHSLMDEAEHFRIVENPMVADSDGNYHEPDKLPSESLDDHERRYEFNKSLLARLVDKVDRETLTENNQVTYDLFRRGLEHSVKSHEFNIHLTPEFFYSGIAGMVKRGGMKTTEDFDNYIKRLEAVPQYFEQHIERLRRGMETGYTMPKVLLTSEDARRGVLYYIVETAEESDFYEPLKEFPSSVAQEDQIRLRDEGSKAIMEHVIASYRNYIDFLDDEYIPAARETIGLNDLPGGKVSYHPSSNGQRGP